MNATATAGPIQELATEPSPRRWTRAEYYQLADLGLFHGQRAELLEGTIMVMSPQKFAHTAAVDQAAEALRNLFRTGAWVRAQAPLHLGQFSEPEPDVSVVAGARRDYTDHPIAALLLVEISDTSLAYDRGRKASLYARMGIADYWIVNLVDRQVEVYRTPLADTSQPYGFRYADVTIKKGSETVTPLALPQASIAAAALLP